MKLLFINSRDTILDIIYLIKGAIIRVQDDDDNFQIHLLDDSTVIHFLNRLLTTMLNKIE